MKKSFFFRPSVQSLALLLAVAPLSLSYGADEPETPVDPELAKLQLAAEKAKAEAEIAKAKRDVLNASLPDTESKGLEGTTKLDKVTIESHFQTYTALDNVAEQIAAEIRSVGTAKKVVIRNPADVNALIALRNVTGQIKILQAKYDKALGIGKNQGPESAGVLFAAASAASLLGSIGDVAAYFKVNTEISGVDVTLTNSALVPALAQHLAARTVNGAEQPGISVYYPELYPANLLKPNETRALNNSIQQLGETAEQAKLVIAPILADNEAKITETKNKIAELQKKLPTATADEKKELEKQITALNVQLTTLQTNAFSANALAPFLQLLDTQLEAVNTKISTATDSEKDDLEVRRDQLGAERTAISNAKHLYALNAITEKLFTALSQTDANGLTTLAKLQGADELRTILSEDGTYILDMSSQKAGGNNKTISKSFFSSKDYYSGGAIVSFALYDKDGAIKKAGVVSKYEPYKRWYQLTSGKTKGE